jgi:hypothetical protein
VPILRIELEPFEGWRNRWAWRIAEDVGYPVTPPRWEWVSTGKGFEGASIYGGAARTQGKARKAADKALTKYLLRISREQRKRKRIEDGRIIEPVG